MRAGGTGGLDSDRGSNDSYNMLVELKTRKIGNSVGVILPKQVLERLKVQEGDRVFLSESPDGSYRVSAYDPEFERQMSVAASLTRRYRNTLRELAK